MTTDSFEIQLFNTLRTAFSLEDLRTVCFLLGLDHDSLKQDNRDVLAREMVDRCRMAGRLPDLRDVAQRGIYVHDYGQGVIECNDIVGNARAGIMIRTGGNPIVRNNRIHDNGQLGIRVIRQGSGTFAHNHLYDNVRGAWLIGENSLSLVKRTNNLE